MTAGARVSVLAAVLAAVAVAAVALGAPSRSQNFFRDKLLSDTKTARDVRALLRSGGGFVDGSIAFRDLTGDKKSDAVVRVQSGTADGAVAVYVFSTDGAADGELRVVHRMQRLRRAFTSVRKGALIVRSAAYEPGDELCCPAKLTETTLRWNRKRKRFDVEERRTIAGPSGPTGPSGPSGPTGP